MNSYPLYKPGLYNYAKGVRKEHFSVGSFVHVLNRGAHKMPIVKDDDDRWQFLKLLKYVNDENVPRHWIRDIGPEHIRKNFARPTGWPAARPYVSILSYCLLDNHFHLLLRENIEGGISKFMQRVSKTMATNFNLKYQGSGSLFEGPYRARVVEDDTYLQSLAVYINVKNTFELFPGGLDVAIANFSTAYDQAAAYKFASMADFAGLRSSSILDHALIKTLFPGPQEFRASAQELMNSRREWKESQEFS